MSVAKIALLSTTLGVALVGCGGGSTTSTPVPPVVATSSTGVAVDGYLSGSTVLCDTNGDGIKNGTEVSVLTGANGNFTFSPACTAPIVVSGGTNIDTGFAFTGVLRAPASATVVTPLTTLMVAGNLTAAEVATALGLPEGTDVTKVDPANGSNPDLFKKTLAAQQMMAQLATTFSKLTTTPGDVNTLYGQVATALAATIKASPTTRVVNADGSVNVALLTSAANTVGTALGVTVTEQTRASIADQIATQSERFLNATAAEIVAVSRAVQAPTVTVDVTAGASYMALANDSILLNDTPTAVSAFSSTAGVTVNDFSTLGIPFQAVGTPSINATVGVAMDLAEVGGQSRRLKLMIDRVAVAYNPTTLAWSIAPTSTAKVYVHGVSADGTNIDMVISDLSFQPLSVVNNRLTLNYLKMIDKVLSSTAADNVKTTAAKFKAITGTFDMSMVVTRMNIRRLDGTAFETVGISIPGANNITLGGNGIRGRVTLQAGPQ